MIRPKSNTPVVSSRNSTCSIDKPTQRSRRSSFVQTLIAQYKNTSQKKSQKPSNPSHIRLVNDSKNIINNKINFKSSSNSQHSTVRQRQNIPQEGKQHLVKKPTLKIDHNSHAQQVHFPLKDMNFMEKYRSTELTKEPESLNILSRKGSHYKKKHSNPVNSNIDSNYESEFLKTMFFTRGKAQNELMAETRFNEKRKTVKGNNFDIQAVMDQTERENTGHIIGQLELTEQKFERDSENVLKQILVGKYQQGLNQLLKMRKTLKEMGQKYQYNMNMKKSNQNSQVIQRIERREFMTLFLYGMILIELNQTNRQKEIDSIVQKLQKKSNSLSKIIGEHVTKQLRVLIFIIKMNKLVIKIKEQLFIESIQSERSKSCQILRENIKGLINQCKQIGLNLTSPVINSWLQFVSVYFNESQENTNNLQRIIGMVLGYLKDHLSTQKSLKQSNNFNGQKQKQYSNTQNNSLNRIQAILVEKTIFKTVSILWNHINNLYMSFISENLYTSQIYEKQKKILLKQTEIIHFSFNLSNNIGSNIGQIDKDIGDGMDMVDSMDEDFKYKIAKRYKTLIDKIIILKSFLMRNHSLKQDPSACALLCDKQGELSCLENEIIQLKDLLKKTSTSNGILDNTLKGTQNEQQSQSVIDNLGVQFMMTFPQVFIYHYTLLKDLAFRNDEQKVQCKQQPIKYLHKQLSILQSAKISIDHQMQSLSFSQQQAHFQQIQFSQHHQHNHKVFLLQDIQLTELQSLNEWITFQLIKVYFQIGQISCASDLILQNYSHLLNCQRLNSSIPNFNNQKFNNYMPVKQLNSTQYEYFTWSNLLNQYKNNNLLHLTYISWKSLQFTCQLNLSSSSLQNSSILSILSPILLNLLHQTITNLPSSNLDHTLQQLLKVFTNIFDININLTSKQNNVSQKITTEVKRLIQIHTSLQLIHKPTQTNQIDPSNVTVNTFDDDDQEEYNNEQDHFQINEQDCNSYQTSSLKKINPTHTHTHKFSRYSQLPQQIYPAQNHPQNINQNLTKFLNKIQKPSQYHINYLKSQFTKLPHLSQNENPQNSQNSQISQLNSIFDEIFTNLQDQFEIMLQLH